MLIYQDEDIINNQVLTTAFYNLCLKKIVHNGYCDMNEVFNKTLITKTEIYQKLKKINSSLASIYKPKCPDNITDAKNQLFEIINDTELSDHVWEEDEYCAMLKYLFRPIKKGLRQQEASKLFKKWHAKIVNYKKDVPGLEEIDIRISEGIAFNYKKIDLRIVSSIVQYIELLDEIKLGNRKYFFRGHSDISYSLKPSVFREDKWLKNEKRMYQELMINCTQEFSSLKSHIEVLAEMQHYCLPTRLLDITENPLIALYFACEMKPEYKGEVILFAINKDEIKYPQSDTVALLASLPLFTYDQQCEFYKNSKLHLSNKLFNSKIKRLNQEVMMDRTGFTGEVNADDLRKNVVVIPARNNRRIAKQEGAFILCGLLDEIYGTSLYNSIDDLRVKDDEDKLIICVIKNKEKMISELNSLGVNKSKIYPEIDNVAEYIKNNIEKI